MCVPSCDHGLSVDHTPNTQDTCYKFWPDKEMTPDVYGFVGVVMKQVIQYNGFTAYVCDICNEAQVCMCVCMVDDVVETHSCVVLRWTML